jgi:hypothetical protein
MSGKENNGAEWILIENTDGKTKPVFVRANDETALEQFRVSCGNTNIRISACGYNAPDSTARRVYSLYCCIVSSDHAELCATAIHAVNDLKEASYIEEDCTELLYDGNNRIFLIIPPIVFSNEPSSIMAELNHRIARNMHLAGIPVDADCYQRDFCFPLFNSINSITGRYVIRIDYKQILYGCSLLELSKTPGCADPLCFARQIPEAVEWFADEQAEIIKSQTLQDYLLGEMMKQGWQIFPCIRQLRRVTCSKEERLEVCRTLAQFLAWIKAAPAEICHQIRSWEKWNPIEDRRKTNAIIMYSIENPGFAGCEHPLLRRFCPYGKCFIADFIDEYEKPYLFNGYVES